MKAKPYLLAAASGILTFFAFPNILHLEFGPLAFFLLCPLLFALDQARSTRHAAIIAFAFGLIGYPVFYHWLVYTMHTFGSMSLAVSVSVLLALVLLLSAYIAVFGAAYHLMTQKLGLTPLIAAPIAWVTVEFMRAHFPFGGFPWALMAYSQYKVLPLIQISELTGPYGVSFIIVFANAALAEAVRAILNGKPADAGGRDDSRLKNVLTPLAIGAGPIVLALIYGFARIPMVDKAFEGRPEIKVGIVQANVDQSIKWSPQFFWKTMQDHMELTRRLLPEKPRLVMWPEAAVTISNFNEQWVTRSPVIDFLSSVDASFLVGTLSRDPCGPGEYSPEPKAGNWCYFNSVYLLSPGAQDLLGRYDKMRLVPFSEYVPMAKLFFFADAIAKGNTGGTTPGREVRVFGIPEGRFGCVICYEVIFPHIVRRFVDQGAVFMTTITNDAWFGKTGAPYQHHSTVIFRSIENRVYFARSANTGISSIVDPVGRIVHQTPIYQQASFTGVVKPSPLSTFYTRHGDLFAITICAMTIIACAYALILARKQKKAGSN
ncbi:MAG TPA: apolipoprotein N-acyltransferase [bacterium]|nr:apolipoprotein N-acyltransferase [bacterium]